MSDATADAGAGAGATKVEEVDSVINPTALRCRFYEKKFPDADEVVMVNVTRITQMGAYVTLLEYNNIEGMVMYSELSRRRIRSINKLIRVGKQEAVMVMRVDPDKGYIDLSKRRVAPEDVATCEDRYIRAKTVHSILRQVASTVGVTLESLYQTIGWPLYKKHGHAYEAFRRSVGEPDIFEGLEIPDKIMKPLKETIRRRLTPKPIKVRADIEVRCFTYEGIDAIRDALLAGQAQSTEDVQISVKLIAPPLYVLLTSSLSREKGLEAVNKAIEAVRETIEAKGGKLSVKVAPRVTTQREDHDLQRRLAGVEEEGEDDLSD